MPTVSLPPGRFFDRQSELAALDRAWRHRGGGQMAMVHGRRRLGKTYLLQHYFTSRPLDADRPKPHCYYLAEQSTAEVQRLALAQRLLEAFPAPRVAPEEIAVSWNALLRYFSQQAAQQHEQGRVALVLDEFPYLVAQSRQLPSVIQAWWDQEGAHLPVFAVICGSQLSIMAALGRESAPLYGRFNAGTLRVEPLRYDDVACFYEGAPAYDLRDKLLMFGILGGTPRYHAMADSSRPLAEEVVSLLMRPSAVLESEVRYLLSSEQIRDPSPHNAILHAIAHGRTQFSRIQQATGIDNGPALAHPLRTLQDLGWVRRETPFGEQSDRRAIYKIADPFLHFWYRFVAPLSSALQFSDPMHVYQSRVEPYLSDYMGWRVFEDICVQWLQKHAHDALGLDIQRLGRYWSRDGQTEIDIVAELGDKTMLFGECKWSAQRPLRLGAYADLQAKVLTLPHAHWREDAAYVLFSLGGFEPELRDLAKSERRLHLVDGGALL